MEGKTFPAIDPKQRIDEFITRMRYFEDIRKVIRLLDPGILAYCWSDRTPDDDGPYLHPPLKYDSGSGLNAFPVKREVYDGTLVSSALLFTNDGANSGNHSVLVQPAAGCPMEVLYASVKNQDTSARTCTIRVMSAGGVELIVLATASLAAAAILPFPAVLDMGSVALPFDSARRFQTDALAVAVSQDSVHTVVYRYFGDTEPTLSTNEPTNCVVSGIV